MLLKVLPLLFLLSLNSFGMDKSNLTVKSIKRMESASQDICLFQVQLNSYRVNIHVIDERIGITQDHNLVSLYVDFKELSEMAKIKLSESKFVNDEKLAESIAYSVFDFTIKDNRVNVDVKEIGNPSVSSR